VSLSRLVPTRTKNNPSAPAPQATPLPAHRCCLDRQGLIQALAGLVIALIALLTSYGHIGLWCIEERERPARRARRQDRCALAQFEFQLNPNAATRQRLADLISLLREVGEFV